MAKKAQFVENFLSEVKLWQSIPNRREPVGVKIVLHMHKNSLDNNYAV